ncbi:MAG: Phage portal protein [Candidatus Tokpelaia hoelldobleri]|uniref:Phage portal protein n=1 Tax=Candidatus Tokpelaia hoelldobleri TaxID=1902579 RepID=A0A1U9JSG7_9HYPH|nr:MAG: Phage portal protein [Candidatus Tokpelaia hoelldoblerii]
MDEMNEEGAGHDDVADALARQALTQKLIGWFRDDMVHTAAWRKMAREDYAFYNGDQWSAEDMAQLQEQKRPVMTFNRVAPLVNAVIGAEINNRRQVRYIPREVGDSIANEVLTGAGEWFREQAGAEDEDSEAFADTVICGMGWTDTRLDFDNNPDGDPVMARLDPMKMVWDWSAAKPNLADARRLWYVDEKPFEDVQAMFPDMSASALHAGWAKTLALDPQTPHEHGQEGAYQDEGREAENDKAMCTLVECRWLEREPYFRAPDVRTGQLHDYGVEEFEGVRAQFPDLPHMKQYRKVVRRAFIGREVLAEPDKPLAPPGQFGWECITGYYDKLNRQFYGVVRPTKDPQRWTNKFFSQVMYLLNSQAKGGIMAERGAFEDDRQAEESWTRSDSITWTRQGAMAAGKIQPKPVAQFPAGFFTLFNESKEAITQVTGLSAEFIGTREVNQPGVLESQRRQSSLNLLASLFNALRRYRKRQGEIVLYLIQNYLTDGRLVRIVGEEKSRYVPLTREAVADRRYDIIVDDAPTSPNEKERTFAIVQQMLPLLKDYLTPEIGLEILRYSPLPASLVDRWAQKAQEARQQAEQQQQQPSLQEQEQLLKMQAMQAELQAKQMEHMLDLRSKEMDLYLKQSRLQE